MRYTIEHNDSLTEVEIHELSPGQFQIRLGDRPPVLVEGFVRNGMVHLLHERDSHMVRIGHGPNLTYAHNRGEESELTVLDARAARRRNRERSANMGSGNLTIKSPMPGRIVKVMVELGQFVSAGQGVVIVEAMKMENELRAETDGIVDSIEVNADDRVEGNAILVRLKASEGA